GGEDIAILSSQRVMTGEVRSPAAQRRAHQAPERAVAVRVDMQSRRRQAAKLVDRMPEYARNRAIAAENFQRRAVDNENRMDFAGIGGAEKAVDIEDFGETVGRLVIARQRDPLPLRRSNMRVPHLPPWQPVLREHEPKANT